ncbi:MAG: hypothetical protein E7442_09565 [Ruminococcaceae bacterium]|nr:hypothetical protein [Oscillospiraceae bacterium]
MKIRNVLSVLLGTAAAAMRYFQCRTVFEPDTMLSRPHIISLILPAFLALCAFLFAVTSGKKAQSLDFSAAFRKPSSGVLLAFHFFALLYIPAGAYLVKAALGGSTLMMIFGGGAAVTGACLFLGLLSWRRERPSGMMLLIPVFFSVLWLFTVYQDYASWPVIEIYFVPVLAIAAIAYAFYQVAACAFSQGNRRMLRFILPTAVILSFAAMGDSLSLPVRGLFLASLGTLYCFSLCLNTENK